MIDLHPLTADVAPPAEPPYAADAPAGWVAFGGLLALPSLVAAWRMRGTAPRAR